MSDHGDTMSDDEESSCDLGPCSTTPPGSPPYADTLRDLPPGRIYGKPAMRIAPVEMLEEVPTHDGTPYFTIWERWIHFKTDPRHVDSKGRPKMGLQIYDVTPGVDDKEHLRELARHLDGMTRKDRDSGYADRLDIYGLPLLELLSEEEKVQRCIEHNVAERNARNATGRSDYYIPRTHSYGPYSYQRYILIVDTPRDRWEEGGGGFIIAKWDKTVKALGPGLLYYEDQEEVCFERCLPEDVAVSLRDSFKQSHGWFMESYVWDGHLDREVAEAAREAQERAQQGPQQEGQQNGHQQEGSQQDSQREQLSMRSRPL